MPWSGLNVSFTAYSGLVPMSPNTTPSASNVSFACFMGSEDVRPRDPARDAHGGVFLRVLNAALALE